MIVPPWIKLAGAIGLFVAGLVGGWTVRDWKRDSEVLEQVAEAAEKLETARAAVDKAAGAYEQEKADAIVQTNTRSDTIREIYRDAPAISPDCAVPDAVARVLDDAIATANARASGQSAPAVPGASGTP